MRDSEGESYREGGWERARDSEGESYREGG